MKMLPAVLRNGFIVGIAVVAVAALLCAVPAAAQGTGYTTSGKYNRERSGSAGTDASDASRSAAPSGRSSERSGAAVGTGGYQGLPGDPGTELGGPIKPKK
jgi:hypothetical protein